MSTLIFNEIFSHINPEIRKQYSIDDEVLLRMVSPWVYRQCGKGGPRSVFREYADAARGNNGNDWRWALFVGGRRVVRILDQDMYGANVLDALAYPGPFKVILADKEA